MGMQHWLSNIDALASTLISVWHDASPPQSLTRYLNATVMPF